MIPRRLQYEAMARVVGPAMLALEGWQAQLRRFRRRQHGNNPFGPPLESSRKLKDLMSLHYLSGRYADGAVPVAWVTSGFPVEFLRPFDFHVVYPENHGALCGARRLVPELAEIAEREGYSRDLCAYARADIGSVLSGKTPVGRLPKPDLLCCCTNICQTVLYWYRALADYWDVPLVVVDTPFVYGDSPDHHLDYVRDQLHELVDTAAKVSGKPLEPERLGEVVRLSIEGTALYRECLNTARHRPSPWTGFDGFIHMAPTVALRGTEECNEYYRALKDELEHRIARGIGGIAHERYRLLWDNLPIWYRMRHLATTFAEAGFNFVCATYTNAWAEPAAFMEPSDPFGSAARAYTWIILNRDLPNRLRIMRELVRDYEVDGAVLHSDRSCKPYSVGQIDLKRQMAEELGIKVVILEADHADPRAFSEEQIDTRIQAFIESFA
jgi:benzoyl-CoA reductase/2-hydroxyglutaryl-CoA dehydratase subunit BcrC/BadD/HgdB